MKPGGIIAPGKICPSQDTSADRHPDRKTMQSQQASSLKVIVRPITLCALCALVLTACGDPPSTGPTPSLPSPPLPPPPREETAVLVGAGDIGWCSSPAAVATGRLLDSFPGTVFTTGDNAYMSGTGEQFQRCYDPVWGRHKSRTRPSPGNHDYETAGGSAYFSYFGMNAGPPDVGYYSYDLGAWHLISLNSMIPAVRSSAQGQWLRRDLEANRALCTIAYWHSPLFSSGPSGNAGRMRDVWRILYEAGADVVLAGDDHDYERFGLQDPEGAADPLRGIRQFVVGTGGAPLYSFQAIQRNSEVRAKAWGVLKLTLRPGVYDWEFVPIPGESFRDFGTGECH